MTDLKQAPPQGAITWGAPHVEYSAARGECRVEFWVSREDGGRVRALNAVPAAQPNKSPSDADLFVCDEAACRRDAMFYEIFEMDDRWDIIRAILAAAPQVSSPAESEPENGYRAAWADLLEFCNSLKLDLHNANVEADRLRAEFKAKEAGWNETIRLYNRMKDERDAALAAVEQRNLWQPIETAPRDGTSVLVVFDETIVAEAAFDIQDDSWWLAQTGPHDFDPSNAIYPTLWMPMPEPPALPSTEGKQP